MAVLAIQGERYVMTGGRRLRREGIEAPAGQAVSSERELYRGSSSAWTQSHFETRRLILRQNQAAQVDDQPLPVSPTDFVRPIRKSVSLVSPRFNRPMKRFVSPHVQKTAHREATPVHHQLSTTPPIVHKLNTIENTLCHGVLASLTRKHRKIVHKVNGRSDAASLSESYFLSWHGGC